MTMKAIVMCLIVAGIILCVLVPSTLAQTTQISVEPSHLEVSQGENFTVNIMVNPAGSEVMSTQYDLHFDNTLLNVVDQSKGTFLSHDGASTINVLNNINNTGGWVGYGETRTGVTNGVTTSGILASITFQVIAEQGVSELHLKDVKVSDPNANPVVSIEVNNGTCNIIEQTPTQTPTSEPLATATTPAQTIRTPDANRTSSQPLNASTTPTAVHTPVTTQTTPTSRTTSTIPPQTIHTPAEKGLPGFEASLTIAWMLVAFIIRGKVMKK
jgi:hypothetical protein